MYKAELLHLFAKLRKTTSCIQHINCAITINSINHLSYATYLLIFIVYFGESFIWVMCLTLLQFAS